MKKIRLIFSVILCLLLTFSFFSCKKGDKPDEGDKQGDLFELPHKIEVMIGEDCEPSVKFSGEAGKVTYESSDECIMTVTDGGLLHGVKEGNCQLTARMGGTVRTCPVTVRLHVQVPVLQPLNKVINLDTGDIYILPLCVMHAGKKADAAFVFESDNPSVAEADKDGRVTAKSKGTAHITFTYEYIGYSETGEITVNVID